MPSDHADLSLLSPAERRDYLRQLMGLTDEEFDALSSVGGLSLEMADGMIENVIGLMQVPVGIVQGFLVNGKDYLVPMATEQSKVIAMAVRGAGLVKQCGGFVTTSMDPIEIGLIQMMDVPDYEKAMTELESRKDEVLALANTLSRTRRAVDLRTRVLETDVGLMLIVELLVDVRDSFGANLVDSMCEKVSPMIASIAGGETSVRVISNLSSERRTRVEAVLEADVIGDEVLNGIVSASRFADADPYRAATQNKGIMNGVSAVLMATNNDTRAVEAGAHAFAALSGKYRPLSEWARDETGDLRGVLEMPMSVGIIGGTISANPTARIALKILGAKTAKELGDVATSVGLACNLGALHALVTDGISSI